MNKIVTIALSTLVAWGASAETSKIGVVDMRKAITTVKAGKQAMEKIQKEFKAKEKEFQAKEKKLLEMRQDLEKKAVALTDEQKQKKGMEFQKKMMEFQNEVRQSQEAIQVKERDLTAPLLKEMEIQIQAIAKEKAFDIVLQKNEQTVLFVNDKAEITDELIRRFDANYKPNKKD